ncbi:hypothetical protein M3923_003535 [Vibrio metschnikovii]|uniref:hypothetical protein n=1 Tax=Vibrio TaxID=662 RepID=UPI0012AE35D1|nr:hypothetical protein [Vibrio sp. A14(2019)]EKO3573807.1 hypothetical protein [Vibrio metschnikovii]EKO3674790.1 hypothetical protein [Vibrio metschnikovii]EKO3708952.1 hypothetical protein [Vibrio metschnikovii]MDQ2194908.1 hypothetical protein [Vibrio sp. A14(2019)]
MFRKLFEDVLENENKKEDVIINELTFFSEDNCELFDFYNICHDEIISFSLSGGDYNRDLEMPGFTIFFINNGKAKAAIFINGKLHDLNENQNELCKYITLIHEIGHVNDFRKCKNINWKKRSCNLVMAEAFAEIHSLKYFSLRNDQYHRLCRKVLANRILNFENYGDIYQAILLQILKTYPQKKLLQWSINA